MKDQDFFPKYCDKDCNSEIYLHQTFYRQKYDFIDFFGQMAGISFCLDIKDYSSTFSSYILSREMGTVFWWFKLQSKSSSNA